MMFIKSNIFFFFSNKNYKIYINIPFFNRKFIWNLVSNLKN